MIEQKTQVLIVGAGPTGLTASLLLSKLGINHVLIEKRLSVQEAPAAHVINRRTLEILRQCGLSMDRIYGLDKHGSDTLPIRWAMGLTGPALGHLNASAKHYDADSGEAYSQEQLLNISQPLLEAELSEAAAKSPFLTKKEGLEWIRFVAKEEESSNLPISEVKDRNGKLHRIEANYVLAADGSGSAIRRSLNIQAKGPDKIATFLSLSCAVDQTKLKGENCSLIDWCLNPALAGVAICHDPKRLTVYMRPIHEPFETLDDFNEERCNQILSLLFGPNVPFDVLHKGIWKMTAQIAEHFQSGRTFLVGDAAHRFPPTGGLGLNSGVADVHNLVWKLSALLGENTDEGLGDGTSEGLCGDAGDDLAKSYELERKPVAQRNCDVSLTNFLKMDEVIQAIGIDPSQASLPARIIAAPIIRSLPNKVKSAILGLLFLPVNRILSRASANTKQGEQLRETIQKVIDNQKEHFEMPGLELGYIYASGCAVSETEGEVPQNSVLKYKPVTFPGARFPHLALKDGTSMLDLFAYERYTLVINGTVADEVEYESFGFPVKTINIQDLVKGPGYSDLIKHQSWRLDTGATRWSYRY